ncbi:MAG: efflux RND transporter periplasmic adaptor subunit [Myxococcota bacterium]
MFVLIARKHVLLVALFGLSGCALGDGPASAEDVPSAAAEVPVRLTEVREARASDRATFHGVVRSTDRATLSFAVGGRLLERRVDVGDRVSRGDVLARVDGRAYRFAEAAAAATLRELDAQHEQLSRDEARVQALRADGVSSQEQLEATSTGVARLAASREAAAQNLSESRRRRSETLLRAPFDGVVQAVLVEEGIVVGAGMPILALAGAGAVEVHGSVPERVALWLEPGASAEVELPVTGERHEGRVVALSDAAGPAGLFDARVSFSASSLVGRSAIVHVQQPREAPELRVDAAAIVDPSGDAPYVWRVDEGTARRSSVRVLGLREDGEVAIDSEELVDGDVVVRAGQRALLDGDAVITRGNQ